jgi:phospholipid/cholesterol/gamma-HCH transport system substrate-binding protein
MKGRDPSRATLAARGLVAMAVIALVVGLLMAYGRGAFDDRMAAVARVDDVGGSLVQGSDVKYDGVIIGRVAALGPADRAGAGAGVEVALDLEPALAEAVPGNVVARVLPASVFGTSYVDLRVPGEPRGHLRPAQRIAQDTSAETLEIQRLLDGLDRVVRALGPAELATSLEALAGALDGNGDRLGETIEEVHGYLRKLNPAMPLVRRNLALLATNLEAFEEYAPGLLDATDDVLVAAGTLSRHEDDFRALVRSGSRTFDKTTGVLQDNREALAAALVRTASLVGVLHDHRWSLVRGVLTTTEFARRFGTALPDGQYLRIHGNLVTGQEPYGRDRCPSYGRHRGRGC